MMIRILLLVSMIAGLTACPTRKVQRRPHEGPVAEEKVELPTVKASEAHFSQAPVTKAETALRTPKADLYNDVVAPLGQYVMNRSYVENPEYAGTVRLRSMLNMYNRALIQLVDSNNPVVAKEKLLEKYEAALLSGCDLEAADLTGCVNLKFFRSDTLTAKIVQRIAARKADVREYYKLLALAYELQNRTKDRDLEFMYFKRAREYAAYFRSLPETDKQKPLMRRHGIIFETLLRDFTADPSNPDFRKFVFEFEPWTYSRLESNPFRYGTQRLFQLVAENYMYEKNGALNAGLAAALKASQERNDPLGPSFTTSVKCVLGEATKEQCGEERRNWAENKNVLTDLKIDAQSITSGAILDEYFFIVDRLYRGHLDVDEAVQIWLGSKRDSKRLLDTIALYLRVEIVKLIIETNEFMAKIYMDPRYDSTTMIRTVLEQAKEISDKWLDMLKRSDHLKRLVNSQLKKFAQDSPELAGANKMFDSLRRNIKYMVVYPNMFVMSYFISKNQAKFIAYTWFGPIEIDHSRVVNAFLSGAQAPWFQFGNDELPLSQIEMLYAYYFSLNNGSFETFAKIKDTNGDAAVDRFKFLAEIIKQYIGPENKDLRDVLEKQRVVFSGNGYRQFQEYCAREKAGDRNYVLEMDFEKLPNFTLVGGQSEPYTANFARAPFELFNAGAAPNIHGALENINTKLRTKLTMVRTMIEILKDDLTKRGMGAERAKQWTEQVANLVNETERASRDLVNETIARHRAIGDCVEIFRRMEFERQTQLYKMEMEHLKSVYRDIVSLQGLEGAALAAKELELNRKYGFTADSSAKPEDGVTGVYKHDVVTRRFYRYSKYELYRRMMQRMATLKPRVDISMPSDLNLSVTVYRTKEGNPINFLDSKGQPVSESEFVASAMRYLGGQSSNNYLSWEQTATIGFNQKRIKALTQLFQITYGVPAFRDQIKPREIVDEVMNMVEIVAIKPEEEEILKIMGRERKVAIAELRSFILDAKSDEELPVMDLTFKEMVKSDLHLAEAKTFYLAIKHAGYFLFAPSDEVLKIMRAQYRPLVDNFRSRYKQTLAALDDMKNNPDEKKRLNPDFLRFKYELVNGVPRAYRAGIANNGSINLLSLREIKDIQSIERDFDRETEKSFVEGK